MRLIDTHCHLQDPKFDADRDEVLARALDALDAVVIIGDDLESSRAAVALCREDVYAAVGFHPYNALHVNGETLDEIRILASGEDVVAIGEIGLDYYNEFAPRDAQRPAFARQLELAAELQMPVVIHNRNADDDAFGLLHPYVGKLPGILMHCFGSDAAFARRCVDAGVYVSFAGNVTYPKAQPLRDAAAVVPLDRLLVETDAPYLAPQPVRGKRCEPAFVEYTARTLADVKGVSLEELTEATSANARAFYRIP